MLRAICCGIILGFTCASWANEFSEQRLKNWHQFRGPEATGVAPFGDPPVEWSETKNVRWKVAIPGQGSASPVVWGERLILLTAIKTDRSENDDTVRHFDRGVQRVLDSRLVNGKDERDSAVSSTFRLAQDVRPAQREDERRAERRGARRGGRNSSGPGRGAFNRLGSERPTNYYQFVVLCINRNTGETIWSRTACEVIPHEGHHDTGSYASSSAITDGEHVWASFGSRGIYCYDMDGTEKWHKDLGDMRTRLAFGEGASPALFGDRLVINWDHEGDSFIVALNALTGDEVWRKQRDEVTTWATPLIVERDGLIQVVTNGQTRVRSYDLKSGEVIWECGGQGTNPIATPVATNDLAICMTGHRDPAGIAVPFDSRGDITDSEKIAWKVDRGTPYVSTPLLYDGLLYFTKSRSAILSCIDAETGEVYIDQNRMPGMDSIYASPVGADGRVYFSSREGVTVVYKLGREAEVLASNQLDETIDASPAIVGKEMYIRGNKHLYCIAE